MDDKLVLKEFSIEHVELLYKWVNDSECRKNSFHMDPISYEAHVKWCNDKLKSRDVDIYIAYLKTIPVGQLRMVYKDKIAIISYSIDTNYRGLGIGQQLIQSIEDCKLYRKNSIDELVGNVKFENIASQRVFEKCHYDKTIENDHFIYRKLVKNKL